MLFGTDVPFDKELGNEAIRDTIRSVEQMGIPADEKIAIFDQPPSSGFLNDGTVSDRNNRRSYRRRHIIWRMRADLGY